MKRALIGSLTILLLLSAGCLSGYGGCSCDEEEHGDYREKDELEETTNGDIRSALPYEADMGAPVYDRNVDTCSIANWSSKTNEELTKMGVKYKTTDDFQTVVDWYEEQSGVPGEMSQLPDGYDRAIWRAQKDGWNVTVTVTGGDGFTEIDILKEKA